MTTVCPGREALEHPHDLLGVFESRLPVGSSASRMAGSLTERAAIATRCR
jgi:hypothetical protein